MGPKTKFWLVAIGSGLPMIATAVAAWITCYFVFIPRIRPFDPKVTFGSPVLKQVQDGLLDVNLVILVSNNGGQAGGIGDMGLHIQSKATKDRWALVPISMVGIGSYLNSLCQERDISSSVLAPFASILLSPASSGSYSVVFGPRPVKTLSNPLLTSSDLVKGETYEVELDIVTTGADGVVSTKDNWKPVARSQFALTQELLDKLKSGVAIIPVDTVRDSLRKKFLED